MSLSRRSFLRGAAGCAGVAAASAYLPRVAHAGTGGPIKRVIIIDAKGGARWNAMYDGQSDTLHNPWGLVPASVFTGAGKKAPAWGPSRMLLQKPLPMNTSNWSGTIYPYLSTNNFNTNEPLLSKWGGVPLPGLLSIAGQLAVVRVTGNPGGTFDSDHASAAHTLHTGYRSGQAGLATVFQDALVKMLGAGFSQTYAMPATFVGNGDWGLGAGSFAASRPLALASAAVLPTTDPGNSVATWGRKMETDVDIALQNSRGAYAAQLASDYVSDKSNGDAHVKKLIDPALHLAANGTGSASLGTLLDGKTAVTNDMLAECFGLTSAVTPAGDPLLDAFSAQQNGTATPKWTAVQHEYGLDGALGVRLLQQGAPVVVLRLGNFDSHSFEVIDPIGQFSHPVHTIKLTRMLAALSFALQKIADPLAPGKSLWDSTVIMVCSEFGRTTSGSNGFNSPNGSNDGGSDHGAWSAWPILGGPLMAGGQLLAAADNGGFFHQNRVFTTLLQGLGVMQDGSGSPYLPYTDFPAIAGLVAGVQGQG